jgi:hypothetical protein
VRGLAVAAAVAGGACVEPFRGSNIQIDFSSATHVAGTPGGSLLPNQPPAGTYYTLYGADQVRAADGTVSQVFLFEIQRFEVRPLVDINSPCYIDRAGTPYPGIHATQFFAKTAADAGIADPLAPPAGADPEVVSRVLTAQARAQRIAALTTYKVVTSASDARYPRWPRPASTTTPARPRPRSRRRPAPARSPTPAAWPCARRSGPAIPITSRAPIGS